MSQVQLIDKLVSVLVITQEQVPTARVAGRTVPMSQTLSMQQQVLAAQVEQRTVELLQIQIHFIDKVIDQVVDMPVVVQRQVPIVQTVIKTMEVQQLQFIEKVIEILAAAQRQIAMHMMQKTADRVANTAVVHQRTTDVPVVAHRQVSML